MKYIYENLLTYFSISARLTAKIDFCLNTGKCFFAEFHLKVKRKSIGYFKIGIFKIVLQNSLISMVLCDNHWKF